MIRLEPNLLNLIVVKFVSVHKVTTAGPVTTRDKNDKDNRLIKSLIL